VLGHSDPLGLISAHGPLGAPAITGQWVNACWPRFPSPLGRPQLRVFSPTVAVIKTIGPLGSPQLRVRHRQTIHGSLGPIHGPLGVPFLRAQQRFVSTVPELPLGATADTRQRLLSDQFPLRRSIVLPDYREDTWLPWVYGYATVSPVPLDAEGLEYLLADHAIVAAISVRSGGQEIDGWQLVQRADDTGPHSRYLGPQSRHRSAPAFEPGRCSLQTCTERLFGGNANERPSSFNVSCHLAFPFVRS